MALAAGATGSTYGSWILAALLFCAAGDVLLIPRGRPSTFLAGALSFLVGHVLFVVAFLVRGVDPRLCILGVVLASPPAILAIRWLRPNLSGSMRIVVYAYIGVISSMVVAAVGTAGGPIVLGASLFYLSDLAVARDRFIARSFWNGAWGLPLYYGAQVLLASTAG